VRQLVCCLHLRVHGCRTETHGRIPPGVQAPERNRARRWAKARSVPTYGMRLGSFRLYSVCVMLHLNTPESRKWLRWTARRRRLPVRCQIVCKRRYTGLRTALHAMSLWIKCRHGSLVCCTRISSRYDPCTGFATQRPGNVLRIGDDCLLPAVLQEPDDGRDLG